MMSEGDLTSIGMPPGGATGPVNTILAKLNQFGGKLFAGSYSGNRMHAWMAGLRDAEEQGLVGNAQLRYADKIMNDTQFIHTGANMPAATRGPFGHTVMQFKQFQLNQAAFMMNLLGDATDGAKLLSTN